MDQNLKKSWFTNKYPAIPSEYCQGHRVPIGVQLLPEEPAILLLDCGFVDVLAVMENCDTHVRACK